MAPQNKVGRETFFCNYTLKKLPNCPKRAVHTIFFFLEIAIKNLEVQIGWIGQSETKIFFWGSWHQTLLEM